MPQIKPDEMIPGMAAMLANKVVLRMDYITQLTSVTSTTYATYLSVTGLRLVRPSMVKLSYVLGFSQYTTATEFAHSTFYEGNTAVGLVMYTGRLNQYSRVQVANQLLLPKLPGTYDYYVKVKSGGGNRVDFINGVFIVEVYS